MATYSAYKCTANHSDIATKASNVGRIPQWLANKDDLKTIILAIDIKEINKVCYINLFEKVQRANFTVHT